MIRRKSFVRWLYVLVAAVQVLLPASASLADGWLDQADSRAGTRAAHVEAYGSTSCARVHPDNCALCRVATALAAPSRRVTLPERIARLGAPVADGAYRAGHSVDHGLPASRAPPRAAQLVGDAV
jgi:hypothetical protein